jgi:hypothetical protein
MTGIAPTLLKITSANELDAREPVLQQQDAGKGSRRRPCPVGPALAAPAWPAKRSAGLFPRSNQPASGPAPITAQQV